jgi:hypothetical protein
MCSYRVLPSTISKICRNDATSPSSIAFRIRTATRTSPYIPPSENSSRRSGGNNSRYAGLKGSSSILAIWSRIGFLRGRPPGLPLCPGLNLVFNPSNLMFVFMPVPKPVLRLEDDFDNSSRAAQPKTRGRLAGCDRTLIQIAKKKAGVHSDDTR